MEAPYRRSALCIRAQPQDSKVGCASGGTPPYDRLGLAEELAQHRDGLTRAVAYESIGARGKETADWHETASCV
jgi:hypothetical protein